MEEDTRDTYTIFSELRNYNINKPQDEGRRRWEGGVGLGYLRQ